MQSHSKRFPGKIVGAAAFSCYGDWELMKSEKLQTKINKYFTIFTLCIIITLSVIIGLYSSNKLQNETGENLTDMARQISVQLDQFMWNHYHQLDLLEAANSLVSDSDYEIASTLINQLQGSFPSFSWVGITDAAGIVKASSGDILLDSDISGRPVFIEGAKGDFIGDVHEAILLSNLLPNPSEEPLRFVDISSPLYDKDGKFKGVLAAHLNWDWAQERVEMTTESFGDSKKIEVLVLSKDYDVLLGPKKLVGESMYQTMSQMDEDGGRNWATIKWPDSQDYLTGYITSTGYDDYNGLGWTVVVRQPIKIAYNNIVQLLVWLIISGFILLLLFMVLSAIISRKLTEPLNQLSVAAAQLKAGHKVTMPDYNGISELETLESALSNLFSDLNITDAALSKMKTIATTDLLTGLKNRLAFENYINEYSKTLDQSVHSLAILYLDLDGFKLVNDQFGHDIGDKLLIEISKRLTATVRSSEILSRIGGDEFLIALIVPRNVTASAVGAVAQRIIKEVNRPFLYEGHEIRVGCSIGSAIFPKDSTELQTVIKYADKALYYSKSHDKNKFTFYSSIAGESKGVTSITASAPEGPD